jgi:hypothetical protein
LLMRDVGACLNDTRPTDMLEGSSINLSILNIKQNKNVDR